MKRIVLLLLAAIGSAAHAGSLDARQVRVATVLDQPGARLEPDVRVETRDDGARVIAVRLTNRSDRDIALLNAEVTVPWTPSDASDFRVATGAMSSGRWPPTLVFDPKKDKDDPVSGMHLLARSNGAYTLAAFISWRTFWSKLHYRDGAVLITVDGEGRRIRAGETVELERVRLTEGPDWQDLLFAYGDAIPRELRFTPKPLRRFVGWSTWDYYGREFTAAAIRGNMAAMHELLPQANIVQIDGGWWKERGDYGGVRADLGPGGMKGLASEIRGLGCTAGLHLDGMRFAPDSNVVRAHPDFFLHDDRGNLLREQRRINGQPLHVFMDYSNPAACAYMRDALRLIRRDWGFEYFKIDFLRAGIAEDVRRDAFGDDTTRRIVPFNPGLTSVERFHRAMAAFREGMGDDAYFVGCSTPFGPTFGYVDALRTGPDIGPKLPAFRSQSGSNAGNFYLHGRVVQSDADYLVVRAKEDQDATIVKDRGKDGADLALNEADLWATYVALCSGPVIESDNLMTLRDERKALVRFAAAHPMSSRFVPVDFWQHAKARSDAFEVFLGEGGGRVYLALTNWNDAARAYRMQGLSDLGETVHGTAAVKTEDGVLRAEVPGRHSALFRLPEGVTFDGIRKALRVE